jgi:hypothetical protein
VGTVLVDANVLLDILTSDPAWGGWSAAALAEAAESSLLAINPIIFAEVSVGFDRIEEMEAALPEELAREALPWDAAFLAGKAFLAYRRRGGARLAPLPPPDNRPIEPPPSPATRQLLPTPTGRSCRKILPPGLRPGIADLLKIRTSTG